MKLLFALLSLYVAYGYGWRTTTRLLSSISSTQSDIDTYHLPPKLRDYVSRLRTIQDDKLRHQQLLHLASSCPPLDSMYKTPENKVSGCLSSVYIYGTISSELKISFTADADSQLTKGLVAMLINGLSECTVHEIEAVSPEFIQYAGIAGSLTPGRNNGFLNMLALIKYKAKQLTTNTTTLHSNSYLPPNAFESHKGPIYNSIVKKLSMLQPTVLIVENTSKEHAQHVTANKLQGKETHFKVQIVAECFKDLSRVQRHQAIYALLDQELQSSLHALSIDARAPKEI